MERTIIHIVGGESRSRAEQARVVFALGHHAEVYSDLEELFDRPPQDGIIMVADEGAPASARGLIAQLAEKGIWLPLVMAAADPSVEQVVVAIKTGALDYLQLPLEMSNFAGRLNALTVEAERYADQRRREVEARNAIGLLSKRERQVLELLSAGCANKEIARRLAISPRTVEIHRGNMMGKLGAGHLADAVHLWVDSQPAGWTPPVPDVAPRAHADVAGRIDRDAVAEEYPEIRRQRQ